MLNIAITYDDEHGTEVQGIYITLEDGNSYWRSYRISLIDYSSLSLAMIFR